jgi:hypothetical protein
MNWSTIIAILIVIVLYQKKQMLHQSIPYNHSDSVTADR